MILLVAGLGVLVAVLFTQVIYARLLLAHSRNDRASALIALEEEKRKVSEHHEQMEGLWQSLLEADAYIDNLEESLDGATAAASAEEGCGNPGCENCGEAVIEDPPKGQN